MTDNHLITEIRDKIANATFDEVDEVLDILDDTLEEFEEAQARSDRWVEACKAFASKANDPAITIDNALLESIKAMRDGDLGAFEKSVGIWRHA